MSDKTDAWMPLWIGAYLADTMHLSCHEHGGYLLLIMAYWRAGGALPADDRKLAAICKASAAEWKRIKPVLEEFFEVADGFWHHSRIDKELSKAQAFNAKQKANGSKGGRPRKTQEKPNGFENGNPNDNPNESSTHTPSPTPSISVVKGSSTHTDSISEQGEQARVATPAGLVCKRMVELGIDPMSCNPGNPTLLALLDSGATIAEFEGAARGAVQRGKGFNYAIGTVKRQREEAAKLVLHQGSMPNKQEKIEESNRQATTGWVPPEMREVANAG